MTSYRRNFIPGGSYFFTVALADRSKPLLVIQVDQLRKAFRAVKDAMPFDLVAIAVLPEHLHCVWSLPPGDSDYPARWRRIKAAFAHGFPKGEQRSASRIAKGERGIWQRRYWEHTLRDEHDFMRHIDYIHFNPVKHGYAKRVAEWPYSSFRRYAAQGIYPLDWTGGENDEEGVFGE